MKYNTYTKTLKNNINITLQETKCIERYNTKKGLKSYRLIIDFIDRKVIRRIGLNKIKALEEYLKAIHNLQQINN
tara:strand:+ start:479 stop:703 length:225 start_codon:yes stop_codon:yes gene_type:complete